ncbi:hypothetical protein BAUCODRAFT_125250 [Baudoinia panamericana UAMH 10762]|uniref:Uncharacterized protein n=1 Tax=Baudoinia panamericana (strain UAMH 10762) TaxID=717646 RepID=M2MPJ4_BAUPA|nr:uncharacterized protein BAUCODRAFT_125250 [Baudoinia panamericana UAMH 10762]EMC93383.1 hypothetical protein BAUCODRAFT_125250 [Baudoinia panamericana UAMH 10762]
MVQRTELRVHAGATSSRRDDDRYRAMASTYSEFRGRRVDHADGGAPTHAASRVLDGDATVLPHEDTTYVDDTQLAYQALESQLITSSLTDPAKTPPRHRGSELEPDSPWPDDLDIASPERSDWIVSVHDQASVVPRVTLDALRPTKRPRRQTSREALPTPVFKPFRMPLKRAASDAATSFRPPQSNAAFPDPGSRTPPQPSVSQSSYLKTPNLVSPELRKDKSPFKHTLASPFNHIGAVKQPGREVSDGPGGSKLPDYRERTPQQRQYVPYVPLAEGSQVGLAFVGDHSGTQNHLHISQAAESDAQTTSELPTTYSLSDITSESSRGRKRLSQRSDSDPGPKITSQDSTEAPSVRRSNSEPIGLRQSPAKKEVPVKLRIQDVTAFKTIPATREDQTSTGQTRQRPILISPDHSLKTAVAPAVIKQSISQRSNTTVKPSGCKHSDNVDELRVTMQDLPFSIFPPSPPVSCSGFTTHVTRSLQWLVENSQISDHFQPVRVTRNVDLLERGYWLFRTDALPLELQVTTWQFLQKMIASGNAGWGIWCVRELGREDEGEAAVETVGTLGNLKIFCWGEVIKHIYLMLYVASKSKVRRLGLQWCDAEEKVVVQMRCAEERSRVA